MKRTQVWKLYFTHHCLKRKFKHVYAPGHLLTRQLSDGHKLLHQKFSSPLQQYKSHENSSFDGVVKSTYPDIEEISPDFTIEKYLWENADQWSNHIAVECGLTGQKYTYSLLRNLVRKFAVSLQKRGYRPGQVISTMLPNIPDHVLSAIGSIEAGLIVSPINPVYTPYELSHQLHDNGAVAVITFPDFVPKLKEAQELIRTKHKTDHKLDIIVMNYDPAVPVPKGVSNFNEMISDHVDHTKLTPHNRTADDVALLPYSSGTTGLAKGVQLTHRNCLSNMIQLHSSEIHPLFETTSDYQDVIPAILPFFHIYGLTTIMMRCLRYGGKLVTLPKFEPASFLSILKDHRATILYVAPPILLFLGNHPQVTAEHLVTVRLITNGAGPVGVADADKVLNRFKSSFVINQGYGLTETSPVIALGPTNLNDVESLGKLVRNTLAKVIKSDGSPALPKEHGEICVKGPQVMLGYHNRPEVTKEVIDEENFFHTGDIGYYDERGHFYIVDRLKELIKVRGYQVPPAELEGLLRAHKDVLDAAVIGVPDAKTGEKPVAFVVLKSNTAPPVQELVDFVSTKVAPYKKLANVVFVDSIPRSPAGKILRRVLKEKHFVSC